MCGRYTIKDPAALAALIAHLTGEPYEVVAARYNICPSQSNPVVRPARKSGKPAAALMRWGYPSHPTKPGGSVSAHANARSEDMFSRATFKHAVQGRRCAVGADGFYEWRLADDRRRLPHHFCLKSGKPFFIAGLYDQESDAAPSSYALLTTGANALMRPVHDRMPVILTEDALDRWLKPGPLSADEARQICQPLDSGEMVEWPVSPKVNSPKNDDPSCVTPCAEPPPEQGVLF